MAYEWEDGMSSISPISAYEDHTRAAVKAAVEAALAAGPEAPHIAGGRVASRGVNETGKAALRAAEDALAEAPTTVRRSLVTIAVRAAVHIVIGGDEGWATFKTMLEAGAAVRR